MSNTVSFVSSYMTNKKGESYEVADNGSCLTLEYTINTIPVRFVIIGMQSNYQDRRNTTIMVKEITDELGQWRKNGGNIGLEISDQYFLDTTTGATVHESKAYDYVDDTTKPIEGTDPVQYEQKQVLKDNLLNEVDYMIQANTELFAITEAQVKKRVDNLYS